MELSKHTGNLQRNTGSKGLQDGPVSRAEDISNGHVESIDRKEPLKSQSNLVFGYLNLFSDGVVGHIQLYLIARLCYHYLFQAYTRVTKISRCSGIYL